MIQRRAIPFVLDQHADGLADLWNTRRALSGAGHVALRHLARIDRRITAHLDGCSVAGEEGLQRLKERLVDPWPSAVFAVAVVALDARDRPAFETCASVAEVAAETRPGIRSAIGFVSASRLAGFGFGQIEGSTFRKHLALAACRLHGVDPGPVLLAGLRDPEASVRAQTLRTVGVLGKEDLGSVCAGAVSDNDPDAQFWATWSAVLLGSRGVILEALTRLGLVDGEHRRRAFRLSMQTMTTTAAHRVLQNLAADSTQRRWLIQGTGIAGDPTYVPWLIGHMSEAQTARAAGEAFSFLTGLDLALLDLERKPPENFESGPNDDPHDPNVDMDQDDGLPWPDPDRIQKWWTANGNRFQPGTRYFMGAPVTREHCIDVLKNGYQRQRILAAHYLCLLDPGTPLFNTSAPAWRQQRLLAKMT